MRHPRLWALSPIFAASLLCAAACGDKDDDDTGSSADDTGEAATGPGTLMLSFAMEEDLIPSMDEDPVGTFRGSIYAEEDASAVGPNDGAASVWDFNLDIDLSSGSQADVGATDSLEPGIYWVLGCLDSDDNDCDKGDPITVPNENKVQVEPGVQTPFEVNLSMLNPS